MLMLTIYQCLNKDCPLIHILVVVPMFQLYLPNNVKLVSSTVLTEVQQLEGGPPELADGLDPGVCDEAAEFDVQLRQVRTGGRQRHQRAVRDVGVAQAHAA